MPWDPSERFDEGNVGLSALLGAIGGGAGAVGVLGQLPPNYLRRQQRQMLPRDPRVDFLNSLPGQGASRQAITPPPSLSELPGERLNQPPPPMPNPLASHPDNTTSPGLVGQPPPPLEGLRNEVNRAIRLFGEMNQRPAGNAPMPEPPPSLSPVLPPFPPPASGNTPSSISLDGSPPPPMPPTTPRPPTGSFSIGDMYANAGGRDLMGQGIPGQPRPMPMGNRPRLPAEMPAFLSVANNPPQFGGFSNIFNPDPGQYRPGNPAPIPLQPGQPHDIFDIINSMPSYSTYQGYRVLGDQAANAVNSGNYSQNPFYNNLLNGVMSGNPGQNALLAELIRNRQFEQEHRLRSIGQLGAGPAMPGSMQIAADNNRRQNDAHGLAMNPNSRIQQQVSQFLATAALAGRYVSPEEISDYIQRLRMAESQAPLPTPPMPGLGDNGTPPPGGMTLGNVQSPTPTGQPTPNAMPQLSWRSTYNQIRNNAIGVDERGNPKPSLGKLEALIKVLNSLPTQTIEGNIHEIYPQLLQDFGLQAIHELLRSTHSSWAGRTSDHELAAARLADAINARAQGAITQDQNWLQSILGRYRYSPPPVNVEQLLQPRRPPAAPPTLRGLGR